MAQEITGNILFGLYVYLIVFLKKLLTEETKDLNRFLCLFLLIMLELWINKFFKFFLNIFCIITFCFYLKHYIYL